MDRRLVAVYTTATLLILALVDSSVAATKKRSTSGARPTVLTSQTPASNRSKTRGSHAARTANECLTCAPAMGRNSKSHWIAKNAKRSKTLPCHPKTYINPKIAVKYKAALRDMRRAGIKPQVTSLWRSSEKQEKLYRCSLSAPCRRANPGIYRALPPGKSLHEAGFAVDMAGIAAGPRGQKRLTSKGRRIVGIMRKNGFKWRYGLKDPAHFEADPRKHGYHTVKQAIKHTRRTCQLNLAKNRTQPNKKASNKVASRVQSPGKGRLVEATIRSRRQPVSRRLVT